MCVMVVPETGLAQSSYLFGQGYYYIYACVTNEASLIFESQPQWKVGLLKTRGQGIIRVVVVVVVVVVMAFF